MLHAVAQRLGAGADGLDGQIGAVATGAVALPQGEKDVGGDDEDEEGYYRWDDEGLPKGERMVSLVRGGRTLKRGEGACLP